MGEELRDDGALEAAAGAVKGSGAHRRTLSVGVTLTKNYGRALMSPIPLEPIGQASRFLTYQWLRIRSTFDSVAARA